MTGMSLYKCGCCDYHFAIEFGHFPDETYPAICPICTSTDNLSFVKDVEMEAKS